MFSAPQPHPVHYHSSLLNYFFRTTIAMAEAFAIVIVADRGPTIAHRPTDSSKSFQASTNCVAV